MSTEYYMTRASSDLVLHGRRGRHLTKQRNIITYNKQTETRTNKDTGALSNTNIDDGNANNTTNNTFTCWTNVIL